MANNTPKFSQLNTNDPDLNRVQNNISTFSQQEGQLWQNAVVYQNNQLQNAISGQPVGNFSGVFTGTHLGTFNGNFSGTFSGTLSGALIFTQVTLSNVIHGVAVTASNPFSKSVPIAFIPSFAISGSGNTQIGIDYYVFSASVSANQYYVTINYDLNHAGQYLAMRKSSDQVIPNATFTSCSFDTTVESLGNAISFLGTKITIKEPGRYMFTGECGFAPNATGERFVWWAKNGNPSGIGNRRGSTGDTSLTAIDNSSYTSTAIWNVTASGDFFEMYVYQNSGGNLNAIGSNSSEVNFQCSRLYNNSIPTGTIVGTLIGIQ